MPSGSCSLLGATLPYCFRRRAPLAVLLVTLVFVVVYLGIDYPGSVVWQVALVGAYTVGSHSEGIKRFIGLGALGLAIALTAVAGVPDADGQALLFVAALFATAWLFGATVRNRRLYVAQIEARAASLERERDEEAKRAVADERLRIAQELHDVVAHSMGVIAVQAGVGAHVIDDDPGEAKRALEAIATTSRSTLTEIRRLLGVLRTGDGAAYAPAPGLGDVDRLADDLRNAGLQVRVETTGTRDDLPPGVDLSGYRIVQEALTNVLKHAGPAEARVMITYDPGVLGLEIVDDGRGVNGRADPGGHGIAGMRERVSVYGGTLEAGPRVGGGFRVAARLPYGPPE